MRERLLVTGAAGGVANLLRTRLADVSKKFRLNDFRRFGLAPDLDARMIGDLADSAFVDQLVQDCDGILHLGGVSTEQPFDEVIPANIVDGFNIYRAAVNYNRFRVIFASSIHG